MGIMRKDIKHEDGVILQQEKTGNAGALSRLNPYPAYKDSGVEWLGEIPTHWEVSATKRVCRITDDRSFRAELKNHLFDQYLRSYCKAEELIKP